jgi:hypothetical protein
MAYEDYQPLRSRGNPTLIAPKKRTSLIWLFVWLYSWVGWGGGIICDDIDDHNETGHSCPGDDDDA